MEIIEKIRETARERPKRFFTAVFLLLFWLLVPSTMQYFYDISAIHVSFAIIVVYYVGLQIYKRRE